MRSRGALLALSLLLNIALVFGTFSFVRQNRSFHALLSPRIFVEQPNDIIINFTELRSELRTLVTGVRDFRTGVYFEYLPSGVSIGINDKEQFVTASLLKVPVIMGVYKLMETGVVHGDQTITLTKQDLDPGYGNLWKRGEGATLTVDEAVQLALTESDNTAALALDDLAEADPVLSIYNSLDIPVEMDDTQPVVSPKNYSSVLRCLYLSCYLSYAGSQKILDIMTQSVFTNTIPAGVPAGVRVAHKVGIYDQPGTDDRVRSDCGIVYVPNRPYILCIFSQLRAGQEMQVSQFIADVSRRVYDYVSTRK